MTESRPVPQFYNQTLLTKKIKYSTPYNRKVALPPRPCKSISPKSSFFNRFSNGSSNNNSFRAQAVSFKENTANQSILSKHYDENVDEPYFQQCFEVSSTLGSGFFGDVFKVKSKEDGQFYAVKRSRERFKGTSDREQKLQEVAKHEHLPEHQNLVKFYKAWEEQQRLYIQIELCECSLSMFADSNHDIAEQVVWNCLIDMLQAVDHLHSHHYLHLDIKPENIFISKDGIYKLGDFGLVVDLGKRSCIEPLEGDPKYLAKETIQGIFTEAADIFSLGITTLELACDLDLPSGDETWHLLRNNSIPEHCFKNISPELKYIIKKMMHSDHTKRPTAAELLNYPIIRSLRRKRNICNKIRSTYQSVTNKMTSFFVLLLNILCIFKLIDFVKQRLNRSDAITSTPVFKKDSSFSHHPLLQSPVLSMYSARKDRTSTDYENMISSLDSSINSGSNHRSTRTPINGNFYQSTNRYGQYNLNQKLQDSTVNSSANPNHSISQTNNHNATNSDITPPMHSFNHYIKNNAELQSTTHRSLRNKKPVNNNNSSSYTSGHTLDFSNSCETPVKKSMFSNSTRGGGDESPSSVYFNNSFDQSNRLDFSEDEDDDLIDSCKLNFSLHNQTVGQRNLLKIFETIDDQ